MSWIKRNLFFVIGGAIAVALLGLAGFYCYTKWVLNNDNLKQLNDAYNTLQTLTQQQPNAGNDDIDNVKLARDYRGQVQELIDQAHKFFEPIPPLLASTNISDAEFSEALRVALKQLNQDAANAGVVLPAARYSFSFEAQLSKATFASGSLPVLSQQLGEVKVLSSILFNAKINSLVALRRERVSSDDLGGLATDYLDPDVKSVTNEMAVLTPYEVRFTCFSPELANVLSRLATDSHGLVTKVLNVRHDFSVGGSGGNAPYAEPPPAPGSKTLPVELDEKQLNVTLELVIVKLLPKK